VEPALKDHIREELREHLSEAVECHVRDGLSEEQAVKRAIEEFGSAEAVGQELRSIHSADLLSFLMKKAMSWKEKTMKTEWKWNFVALAALAFTIIAEVVLGFVCVIYVYPRINFAFNSLASPVPWSFDLANRTADVSTRYGVVLLLLIVCGWILFEFLYRKEGKPNIRLGIFAAVGLAATLFFAAASLSLLVPAAQSLAPMATLASSSALGMRSAGMVERKLHESDALLSEMSDACGKKDWNLVRDDAHDLSVICHSFSFTRAKNLARISGKTGTSDNSKLDLLLQETEGHGMELEQSARRQNLPAVLDNLKVLQESLQELRKALGGG
jgi:HPt (histidine-containing phosphotransfer) domain-containing protein